MKQLLIFLFLIPLGTQAQDDEQKVTDIRAWYKDVEASLQNCIKIPVTMFYDEDYVNGGSTEMEGYYDTTKNEIIKIVEHTYYDWAEDESSFYIKDGKIFFIFSKGNSPGQMYTAEELNITEEELWQMGNEAKTLIYYEDRMYFDNDTCFRSLRKEKEISTAEDPSLKEVKNKTLKIEGSEIPLFLRHGYKMLAQFERQLPKK